MMGGSTHFSGHQQQQVQQQYQGGNPETMTNVQTKNPGLFSRGGNLNANSSSYDNSGTGAPQQNQQNGYQNNYQQKPSSNYRGNQGYDQSLSQAGQGQAPQQAQQAQQAPQAPQQAPQGGRSGYGQQQGYSNQNQQQQQQPPAQHQNSGQGYQQQGQQSYSNGNGYQNDAMRPQSNHIRPDNDQNGGHGGYNMRDGQQGQSRMSGAYTKQGQGQDYGKQAQGGFDDQGGNGNGRFAIEEPRKFTNSKKAPASNRFTEGTDGLKEIGTNSGQEGDGYSNGANGKQY